MDLLTNASVSTSATVTAPTAGVSISYSLDAGEFIQLSSTSSSFSGTVLSSDKPIGVYTGETYLGVVTDDCSSGGPRDSAHQQIPHIQALGTEYIGAGIPTRLASLQNESVLYRITGVADGTTLTWYPSTPTGAPTTLSLGTVAEFQTRDFFSVSSQDEDHPSLSPSTCPGTSRAAWAAASTAAPTCSPGGQGDTDWIHLVPPAQFYNEYSFFTDPTYGITSVSFVRVAGTSGFADVELECMGTVTGWQALGTSGEYEIAHVDLYRGGVDDTYSLRHQPALGAERRALRPGRLGHRPRRLLRLPRRRRRRRHQRRRGPHRVDHIPAQEKRRSSLSSRGGRGKVRHPESQHQKLPLESRGARGRFVVSEVRGLQPWISSGGFSVRA